MNQQKITCMFNPANGIGDRAWPEWACPVHYQLLKRVGDRLFCSHNCAPVNIKKSIPRFVESGEYAEAFGLQWNRYRRIQLDSYSGTEISETRVRRCLGERLWNNIENKSVLECGCGAGRFTEILLGKGAYVTSVDLSDAVDACNENFPVGDRHRIAQADILALPFEPFQFDVVFCLGVIQHTPNPEKTIAALYRHVRPGGTLVLDHYTTNLSYFTKTAPIFRVFLKRMSPERGLQCTEALVDFFLPLHKKTRNLRLGQIMLSRLSPVLCYYSAYPELDDKLQREWALVDTHDSLTDWYKWFRSPRQIRKTLEMLKLENIHTSTGGNGVEARGTRPDISLASTFPIRSL